MAERVISVSQESKKLSKQRLPDLATDIRELVGESGSLPPVDSWAPARVGEIDIRICRDGSWLYQQEPMERKSVVRLLSKILKKEGDDFFLVSPVEKLKIEVEDAPFVITMLDVEGEGVRQNLHFSTQVGDCISLSDSHPLTVEYNNEEEPSPYILVRSSLSALITRNVYYQLVNLAVLEEGSDDRYGVWSLGQFFRLH